MIVGSRIGADESRLYRDENHSGGDVRLLFAHVYAHGDPSRTITLTPRYTGMCDCRAHVAASSHENDSEVVHEPSDPTC